MMRNTLIGALILAGLAGPAFSQNTRAPGKSEATAQKMTKLRGFGGAFDSYLGSDDGGFVLQAGEDKDTASVRFSWAQLRNRESLTISSPVDKDSERADFVGFGGVNRAASAKLDYTYVKWPRVDFSTSSDIHDPSGENERKIKDLTRCAAALQILAESGQDLLSRGKLDDVLKKTYEKVKGKGEELKAIGPRIREYIELEEKVDELPKKAKKQYTLVFSLESEICKDDVYVRLISLAPLLDDEQYMGLIGISSVLGDDQLKLLRRAVQGKRAKFFNLQGQVASKEFEFFDQTDLSKQSERKYPTSFGLSIGWIFLSKTLGSLDDSLALTVRWESGYRSADAASLCEELSEPEPAEGRLERCKSMPLGPPTDDEANFFGLEYRHFMQRLGIGARAFYRDRSGQDNDYGFEVPVYFLPNKEKKLAGGIRLGWSDQDKEEVTVFVGKTFEPLGTP